MRQLTTSSLKSELKVGHKAYFYNIWDGKGSETFQAQLRNIFAKLTTFLASGVLKPKIAARFPLAQITVALKSADHLQLMARLCLYLELSNCIVNI